MDKQKILLILGLAGFVVFADNWAFSPILPAIAQGLGVSLADTALVISAYMIPFGLFQLVFGNVSDRFGKIETIRFCMIFFTIATTLCAIATGLTSLAVYRALTGIFAACVTPVSLALIGDIFELHERQTAIGTFLGINFIGQGLGMAIGGSIAYFVNWRGVFIVYGIIAAASTVLLFTTGKDIPSTRNPHSGFLAPYIKMLRQPSGFIVYLLILLEGFFFVGGFSFLGAFLKTQYNFNYLLIGLITTASGVMSFVGGRFSGKIDFHLGKRRTILLGLLSGLLALSLLAILGKSLLMAIIGVGLLGFATAVTHSTLVTIVSELAAEGRGVGISLNAFCFMCGGGLGTLIGSRILARNSISVLFSIYAAGLLIPMIIVIFNQTLRQLTTHIDLAGNNLEP